MVQAVAADRDADHIVDEVPRQKEDGADFTDVNAGARIGHEEDMKWLLDTVQPFVTMPLTLDRPDPTILEMAFSMGMDRT